MHDELQRLDCKDFILIISSEMWGEGITHKAPRSCVQVVDNLWGCVWVGSLCRGGRGSFPQLLDVQGPSQTLKEQPQGIAPIQKVSMCAAILSLRRIKLFLLIAPLEFWGVSEWGHITTVHIFGITSWRAGRPCPTACSGHAGFRWAWPRDADGAVPIWHCCASLLPDQHVGFSSQEESFLLFLLLNLGPIFYPLCKWG